MVIYVCVVTEADWATDVASHHGGELDSTLVAEAARQAVAPIHVKLAKHIGAKPNFQPLPMVA